MSIFSISFFSNDTSFKKIETGRYEKDDGLIELWRSGKILTNAIGIALMAYSLLDFCGILLFRLPTVNLIDLMKQKSRPNTYTICILVIGLVMAYLRYQQKFASKKYKEMAYHLRQKNLQTGRHITISRLNDNKNNMQNRWHRFSRLTCDCMIVFYNLFFVCLSLLMFFFGAQINIKIFQAYFIWKMVGLSSLCTARISCANQKGSSEYLYEKIAKIADVKWDEEKNTFCEKEDETAEHEQLLGNEILI